MADEDEELVYERGLGYVGNESISGRTLFALLRACAISEELGSEVGAFERYSINETGHNYLANYRLYQTGEKKL
jgi:hypothetical protein